MTIIIVIVSSATICLLTAFFAYRYVKKMFDETDEVLNQLLKKNLTVSQDTTADNRLSKIKHKAHRIFNLYREDVTQTQSEKETIQGFISDVSHQMKTPLAGILMYTEMLQEAGLEVEEQAEFIRRIGDSSKKLRWMTDMLIKMSRLEGGTIELSPKASDITPLVTKSINQVLVVAKEKNIEIVTEDFTNTSIIYDLKWTLEVLVNILENAIKYSSRDDKIKISVETFPLYTRVSVKDFGIGIEKDDWALIFKRFYRGENAKNYDGVGLGLYLATLIMEKQSGYIMVDSKIGKFTTFSLFFQNS